MADQRLTNFLVLFGTFFLGDVYIIDLLYAAQFRSLTLDLGYFLRWGRLGDISAESRADSERPVAYEAYEAVHRRSEKIRTDSQGLRSQNISYCIL